MKIRHEHKLEIRYSYTCTLTHSKRTFVHHTINVYELRDDIQEMGGILLVTSILRYVDFTKISCRWIGTMWNRKGSKTKEIRVPAFFFLRRTSGNIDHKFFFFSKCTTAHGPFSRKFDVEKKIAGIPISLCSLLF